MWKRIPFLPNVKMQSIRQSAIFLKNFFNWEKKWMHHYPGGRTLSLWLFYQVIDFLINVKFQWLKFLLFKDSFLTFKDLISSFSKPYYGLNFNDSFSSFLMTLSICQIFNDFTSPFWLDNEFKLFSKPLGERERMIFLSHSVKQIV